jgi:hypothetical protein
MGKQYNKVEKRARRDRRAKHKKELAKVKGAIRSKS